MDDSEVVDPVSGTLSDDDTGFYLRPAVRGMVSSQFELFGEYEYVDVYDETNNMFEIGGRYYFTNTAAVTLKYMTGDIQEIDIDGFGLGVRVGF